MDFMSTPHRRAKLKIFSGSDLFEIESTVNGFLNNLSARILSVLQSESETSITITVVYSEDSYYAD